MLFDEHLKLSELAGLIEQTIIKRFANKEIWVAAETSDIKNYYDRQYCFLTLVEKENEQIIAKMDAVIWRQQYHIIKQFSNATGIAFEKNIRLLLKVNIGFNPQYGLRLQVTAIDPNYTIGALEIERQAVLAKLAEQNPTIIRLIDGEYVTKNKKLKPPLVIQKIALITAPESDGEKDFKHELIHNKLNYQFDIDSFLTQVQGKGASENILIQLNQIELSDINYDAVIIVRGGGSAIDFSAFDNYELGKKVAGFPMLIIAGIGHHRNVSITDMMCFASVKTPTKAADFILAYNKSFEEKIMLLKTNIINCAWDILQINKDKLKEKNVQLKYLTNACLKQARANLNEREIIVKHLDPQHVLSRGFAIITSNNKILSNSNQLNTGSKIEVNFSKSKVEATVDSIITST